MAANLTFTHPKMNRPLGVYVNPDSIEWSYGLNTQNYPTYGGEVIQILSAFIEDMTITGTVETYSKMEDIYAWFITYIQIATTGVGTGKFNVAPVQMYYQERGWQFQIYPTSMPGFRYGTEVVAPEWSISASVVDPAFDLVNAIMDQAAIEAASSRNGIQLFGKATGNIGFEEHDPFSDPEGGTGDLGKKNRLRFFGTEKQAKKQEDLADEYNKLLPAYLEGDFSDLTGDYSKPVVKAVKEVEEKVEGGKTQKAKAK